MNLINELTPTTLPGLASRGAAAHSSDSGDDEDEPTGYMPSFSSNTRRSAPTPGGMGLGGRMLGGTEGERLCRILHEA